MEHGRQQWFCSGTKCPIVVIPQLRMMNDMAEDTSAYEANLKGFLEKIRGATVEEIVFSIDNDPTFRMEELPLF